MKLYKLNMRHYFLFILILQKYNHINVIITIIDIVKGMVYYIYEDIRDLCCNRKK